MMKRLTTCGMLLVSAPLMAHDAASLDGISHAISHAGGAGLVFTLVTAAAAGLALRARRKAAQHRNRG